MRLRPLVSVLALSLAVATAPAFAERDIDKVFGGITAEAGEEYGSLETVNGGITIRAGATVRTAETVNGGISIAAGATVGRAEVVNGGISLDDDASADSITAVNGGLTLGTGARVRDDAETVNGAAKLADGAEVGGDLETVNGAITLDHARVRGLITTTNGDVMLVHSSVVDGGILVEKPDTNWSWGSKPRIPRIVVGAGSVVNGPMVFERDVELFVHTTAKVGTITGATPQAFTESLPPRE